MKLPDQVRDLLKRYGAAVALASLALLIRSLMAVKEGTSIYQLPIAAVVLSAWYGGRGPGLLTCLITAAGSLYLFIPPRYSFVLSEEYAVAFGIFLGLCLLLSEFSAGRRRSEIALQRKDQALQTARTELARVSRLTTLGELTTSIAHEVSQPLGAMMASAGACSRWLEADPPALAEARAALDNIVNDGKRAREVIARIRTLTRRQVPRKNQLDINHEIEEVLALMKHELSNHDIVLLTDLAHAPLTVTGDRVQLQQVLLNLIVNAVEAMSGVRDRPCELTIVSRTDDSGAVLVEVRDNGTGLDAQNTEQLFEPFYTTKSEGIGIGLAISRSIVEAHGGRLGAVPNEPHGAVFRFSLPVVQEVTA